MAGAASTKPQLEYFTIRGRAEHIRVLLAVAGADYEFVPLPFGDVWVNEHKAKTPLGSVPVWRDGALALGESGAILRAVARKYDVYGADDAQRALNDMAHDFANSSFESTFNQLFQPTFDEKRAELGTKLVAGFERLLTFLAARDGGGGGEPGKRYAVVADKFTMGDATLFHVLNNLVRPVFAEQLAASAVVSAYLKHVRAHDKVAAFIKSDAHFATLLPPFVDKLGLNTPEGCNDADY
mmetsp:Transcript_1369/g.3189  ORF Transcript_1369/g.3189 Transcript_1369/m.3189 type:complete len:239 (-) Transcript_1369:57-773(-)